MTQSRRIEMREENGATSVVDSSRRVALPAFLMWILAIAIEQPIAFPILIGLVSGALADSAEAVLIGIVAGFLMRWVVTTIRPGNGLP